MYSDDFKLYKSLGSLIKDYRQWREVNQETLSKRIGISIRELQRWETDHRRILIENLHDLSEVTGIPMQVCVALNADQPIWYSLRKRRYAYSSIEAQFMFHEIYQYRKQSSDNGILLKCDRISTDKHINLILSCHGEIYGTEKTLQRDVIKTASMILPNINRIAFDSWGHYVGHNVCLPIKMDVYQQLKRQKVLEDYLTAERLSDILALQTGVFFYYSAFATNLSVAHQIVTDDNRYFAKMEHKERYLVAVYTALTEAKEFFHQLGMRLVKDYECILPEGLPKMYEMELDVLMRPLGPCVRILGEDDKQAGSENLIGKAEQEGVAAIETQKTHTVNRPHKKDLVERISCTGPLTLDDPLVTDKGFSLRNPVQNDGGNPPALESPETQQIYERAACPNRKCALHGKMGKGNIVFNGVYRTKEGAPIRQFLCKVCNKSFCSRSGSIFYGLRSPEEKVLLALKLLVKGMSLRSVAEVLGVKRDTVRRWIKVAAKESHKVDAMLMKELKVSQTKLDTLWTFAKKNFFRQRSALSKH